MKNMLLLSTLLLSTLSQASSVTFKINEVKSDSGKVLVQLFKGEENYNQNKAVVALQASPKKGTVTITFNDLDAGEYAIRYFHDENDNGELDANLFGLPTEGYGFSNNAKANFGPASYKQMKFMVDTESTESHSTITY